MTFAGRRNKFSSNQLHDSEKKEFKKTENNGLILSKNHILVRADVNIIDSTLIFSILYRKVNYCGIEQNTLVNLNSTV